MSKSLQWLIVLGIIFAIFVFTKPSDEQCLKTIAKHEAGIVGEIADAIGLSSTAYQVDDYLVYKVIRNRVTGKEVGYGYLGTVTVR